MMLTNLNIDFIICSNFKSVFLLNNQIESKFQDFPNDTESFLLDFEEELDDLNISSSRFTPEKARFVHASLNSKGNPLRIDSSNKFFCKKEQILKQN